MNIISKNSKLNGHITVPGSKSHTIRALLLSALAEGESKIYNPLPSADCKSTAASLPLLGASIDMTSKENVWIVSGAGNEMHLPSDIINAGNSGSLLYFLSPIAATFDGWSVFTGDDSLKSRPVVHVIDVLEQLGAAAYTANPTSKGCPLIIKGPIHSNATVKTEGSVSSQYISGLMMAAIRMNGTLTIELSCPKETPYLTMTQQWLESVGAKTFISEDFKCIRVEGPVSIKAFETTVPSDWEAVAFPLIAALLTDSEIVIENIDDGNSQGDSAIVDVLLSIGADIVWDKKAKTLTVKGGAKAKNKGRLSTESCPNNELHVNLSGYPDAICAMAVIACFAEGVTYIEDISVCRRKETDRIKVLTEELSKTGAIIEEGSDYLIIRGHSPIDKNGNKNPLFTLHGALLDSHKDHRVAMAASCMGLALLSEEPIEVIDAECCAVSFPHFYEKMALLGAKFENV